jgi:hypothetical protein
MILKIAWRNIVGNWRHELAAISSIALSLVSLLIFQGYIEQVRMLYHDSFARRYMYGDIIVDRRGKLFPQDANPWQTYLTIEEQNKIETKFKELSSIDNIVRFLPISGTFNAGQTELAMMGMSYDVVNGMRMRGPWSQNTLIGAPLTIDENPDIVLGRIFAKNIGCKIPPMKTYLVGFGIYKKNIPLDCPNGNANLNVTTESGQANTLTGHIHGITDASFKEVDENYVTISLQIAQKLFNTKRIAFYGLRLNQTIDSKPTIDSLNNYFKLENLNLWVGKWEDHEIGDFYMRTMEFLNIFRNLVLSIILFIAVTSIMTSFYKIIVDRKKEIGLLQCLGFTRHNIRQLFFLEAGILIIFSITLGIIMALVSKFAIDLFPIYYKAGILSEPVPFGVIFDSALILKSSIIIGIFAVLSCVVLMYKVIENKITKNLNDIH